jgi:hypothetical protein
MLPKGTAMQTNKNNLRQELITLKASANVQASVV